MKRKAYKRQRARIQVYFDKWITWLGLRWWDLEIHYYDKRKTFRKGTDARSHQTAMTIHARWEYGMASIAVNVPVLADLSDRELEEAVVHELTHALINEMREDDPDRKHEERVVTTLTNAFMWTRNGARTKERKR